MAKHPRVAALAASISAAIFMAGAAHGQSIGSEKAVPHHLQDGQEYDLTIPDLIRYGKKLFIARWTREDGAGRPLSKGTGAPLTDPSSPLVGARAFNRISGPEASSCVACDNLPRAGGGGDFATEVFALAQRFDFATFDPSDGIPLRGAVDERGQPVTLKTIGNARKTVGMFGSGYIEMLARQMTAELQAIRDRIPPGGDALLLASGVSFGYLSRDADGAWNTSRTLGLPAPSLATTGPDDPPSLILQPFSQAGANVSLRQFTINAFADHIGLQAEERFGSGDPDGDGVSDELTEADITAVTLFQATLPPPGRVLSADRATRAAERNGRLLFTRIGCAVCHIPALPLVGGDWVYTEPGPYNPPGTLKAGEIPPIAVDLTSPELPGPRLPLAGGVVWVPAYTDLKLHDMCTGPDDAEREPLDQNQPAGSPAFFAGNCRFLTRRRAGREPRSRRPAAVSAKALPRHHLPPTGRFDPTNCTAATGG